MSATHHSHGTAETKACPRCAEIIRQAATACQFCGYEFPSPQPATMSEARVRALEEAFDLGHSPNAGEFQEVMTERQRLVDENTACLALIKATQQKWQDQLGRTLTTDEEKTFLGPDREYQDAFATVNANLKCLRRLDFGPSRRAAGETAATQRQRAASSLTPDRRGAANRWSGRAAFNAIMLVIIICGFIAAAASGGSNNHVGPGNASGRAISIKGCEISTNADGSIHARATVFNGGDSAEQANVVITMHWYGGTTDDDSGFLGPNGYAVPPGTHYVGHDFTVSGDKTPVYCDAKLGY